MIRNINLQKHTSIENMTRYDIFNNAYPCSMVVIQLFDVNHVFELPLTYFHRLPERKLLSGGVFRKPQLIFVFHGDNAPPHTFILVEECCMDIESAFPPHAVAPIFNSYEHNRSRVGFTNENIKCGYSAKQGTQARCPATLL